MAIARLTKYFVLAGMTLVIFVSLVTFFSSLAPESSYMYGRDDILGGAIAQNVGHGKPRPYRISDPVNVVPANNKNAASQPKPPKEPWVKPKEEDAVKVPREKKGYYPVKSPQEHFEVNDDIIYDPKGPRPNQVVMLMAGDGKGHNGGIPDLIPSVTTNRKEYAEYHGYIYHFINITKYVYPDHIHPVWKKLPAIVETFNTFPEAQWIWWLDLDAIVMSPEVDLNEHILSHEAIRKNLLRSEEFRGPGGKQTGLYTSREFKPENIDLIIAQDLEGLNAGSFFIRRSKWTRGLMDIWGDPIFMAATWVDREQSALQHLTFNHPTVREHLGIVKQRHINSFAVGWQDMGWFDGDLVVHFAGCWTDNSCADHWVDYWGARTTVAELKKRKKEEKRKLEAESPASPASQPEADGANEQLRRQQLRSSRDEP